MTTPQNSDPTLRDTSEAIAELAIDTGVPDGPEADDAPDIPQASRTRLAIFTVTMFAFQLTLLMPSLFSLAYKAQAIDPADKATSLGLVLGVGGIFGLVAGPIFGVLSDGTRWRWGRRRPYLVIGLGFAAIGALILASASSVPMMVVGWAVTQLAISASSAALNPFMAEQVPAAQRGQAGALSGAGAAFAGVGASLIGSFLTTDMLLLFMVPVAVFGVAAIVYIMAIPDRPAEESAQIGSILGVFKGLWFNPVKHSDFAFVWVGKLAMQFSFTFFSAYQLFFMLDRLGLTAEQAGRQLAAVSGLGLVALVGATIASGFLSDRFGRRKPFIYIAAALIACGLILLSSADSIVVFAIGGVVMSVGTGTFNSVDLAMATDVLPEKGKAGKFMGIYFLSGSLGGTLAPMVAPAFLRIGSGDNYAVLFLAGACLAFIPALTAIRVRGVR